jgi:hypothetical protein
MLATSGKTNGITTVKKNDYIVVKNHPEFEGEIFQIKRVKSDGWAITTEGHLFEPTFFDPVTNWQQHNGGVARFNQTTGEPVEERSIKKYLLQRLGSEGLDSWVDVEIIATELGLSEELIEEWLKNNPESVERDNNLVRYKKRDRIFEIEEKIKEINSKIAHRGGNDLRQKANLIEARLKEWVGALNFKIGDYVAKGDRKGSLADWSLTGDIIQAMVLWDDSTVVVPETVSTFKKYGAPYAEGASASAQGECTNCTLESDIALREEKLKKLEREILEIKQVIVNSFYEIGRRLATIRDEKLYELKNCLDFKEYVAKHFPFGSNYAYKLLAATDVFESIRPVMRRSYTIKPGSNSECTNCTLDLKESHLRPLASAGLTVDDKRNIWENVEILLDDMESIKGKPPKLTSKLVEKTVWDFKSKNNGDRESLVFGQVCKVALKSNIDSSLKKHNNKLVVVVEQATRGVKCMTFWGEPIEDYFFSCELQEVKDEEFYSSSISLPVEVWKKLARKGRSLNEVINHLLQEKCQ